MCWISLCFCVFVTESDSYKYHTRWGNCECVCVRAYVYLMRAPHVYRNNDDESILLGWESRRRRFAGQAPHIKVAYNFKRPFNVSLLPLILFVCCGGYLWCSDVLFLSSIWIQNDLWFPKRVYFLVICGFARIRCGVRWGVTLTRDMYRTYYAMHNDLHVLLLREMHVEYRIQYTQHTRHDTNVWCQ